MKHKKALIYLLGFLVVCIWGLIIMRVYATVGDDEAATTVSGSQSALKTYVPIMQPDTFHLQLNYADPFTEQELVPVIESEIGGNVVAPGNQAMVRPVLAAPPVNPVTTKYLGYIWNAENKKKIAIMNQDGKEMMIEEGGTAGQLELMVVTADSVKVKYKGKTSFIRINK